MTHPALIERITRSLAYMLRHQPEQFDLELDEYGYGDMEDVVHALNERLGEPVEEDDVREAVESGDRVRYEIKGDQIRALYGHSIEVKPGEPAKPPAMLYVGVSSGDADRVRRYGLRAGRRRFLHLALTPEDALETGRRTARDYVVITVRALDAWEEGINFYDRHSLFLSDPIPTHFVEVGDVHSDGRPTRETEFEGGGSSDNDRHRRGRPRRERGPRQSFDRPSEPSWEAPASAEPVEPDGEWSAPREEAPRRAPSESRPPSSQPPPDRRHDRDRPPQRDRDRQGRPSGEPAHAQRESAPPPRDRGGREREGRPFDRREPSSGARPADGARERVPHEAGARGGSWGPSDDRRPEPRGGRGGDRPHGGGRRDEHRDAGGGERRDRPQSGASENRAPVQEREQRSEPQREQPAAPAPRASAPAESTSFGLGIFEGGGDANRNRPARPPAPLPRERVEPEKPKPAREPEPDDSGFGAGI